MLIQLYHYCLQQPLILFFFLIKMGGLLWTGFALFSPTEQYFTLLVATET